MTGKVLACTITNTNIKQNYQVPILTYFVGIMNNLQKIVSAHCVPLEGMRVFSLRKAFHERTNFFGQKN